MTVHIEAMKQALEALEGIHRLHCGGLKLHELNAIHKNHERAITAIKAALAAPVQEPAEQLAKLGWQAIECPFCGSSGAQAFPKPAAQRQWVGLTDDEVQSCWNDTMSTPDYSREGIYRAIEAKLKEKNT